MIRNGYTFVGPLAGSGETLRVQGAVQPSCVLSQIGNGILGLDDYAHTSGSTDET